MNHKRSVRELSENGRLGFAIGCDRLDFLFSDTYPTPDEAGKVAKALLQHFKETGLECTCSLGVETKIITQVDLPTDRASGSNVRKLIDNAIAVEIAKMGNPEITISVHHPEAFRDIDNTLRLGKAALAALTS